MTFETARGIVHARQCDHMGHANLRAYGEFFEQALWQLFFHLGLKHELTAVCIDASTRKPSAFPSEVKTRANRLLHGESS